MYELNVTGFNTFQQQSINISAICQGMASEANHWAMILFLGTMALVLISWSYFILAEKLTQFPQLKKGAILLFFAKDAFVIFIVYKIWSIVFVIK
jgi:hypothetical protein